MSEKSEKSTRILYLSRIRVVASFAIIVLHTFTMYGMVEKDIISETELYVTKLVPWLMMWAVPCFVMVSGVLLLDEKRSITIPKLLFRYVLRMVLVLLLFTALYFLLDAWMNGDSLKFSDITTIFKKFTEDGSWAHLWYLYLLVGLYLLLPAYRLIAKNAGRDVLIYLGVICLIFLSLVPTLERMTDFETGFYICTSSIFPVYFFMGYMINKGQLKLGVTAGIIITAAGAAAIVILSRMDFGDKQASVEKLLGNYAFLPVVILSVGAFVLLKGNGGVLRPGMAKVWEFLDRYSFGIYLTHLIFLRFLIKVVKWNPFSFGSFWMLIPVAILVFMASLLVSILLKMIPGVKKLI